MRQIGKFLLVLVIMIQAFACSQEYEMISSEEQEASEALLRQVIDDNAIAVDSISLMPIDVDSVKTILSKINKKRSVSPMANNYDEYFSSNIYALRELPLNFKSRSNNTYISANGNGKEVVMSSSRNYRNQSFYLKILPASSGIPYLIYSTVTGTPLSVGQYDNNPDKKVLFLPKDNSGSLSASSWDLIPSSYKGYFAIQSQFYLGQSDPNNWWSVFNYALEVQNDKIGYAQYTNKSQQEFLITPVNDFTLEYIEFHNEGKTTNKLAPTKVTSYGKNESEERRPFTITASHYRNDESSFYEMSQLKIPITNPNALFYRPIVEAEKLVFPSPVKPEDEPDPKRDAPDMKYTSTTQTISNTLTIKVDGTAKPNSLIEVTSWLENYSVSAKYTAYMSYTPTNGEKRIVKIKGTWNGRIYTTLRDDDHPKDLIKFYDLDDGEEILRANSAKLSQITFK